MSSTIRDVAKRAGVSLSTASLVLNDRPNVNPETKERVLRAIRELNYHPRRHARALASQKTGNIGFILTDSHFSRAEPFYTKVFLGTEFESRKYSYYILLTTVPHNYHPERDVPRFLKERNVDGVLLAGRVPTALIEYLRDINLPHVIIDYLPRQKQSNAVLIDNLLGASLAVRHLIDLGHRRIAFIGGDISHPSIARRLEGYRQTLLDSQTPVAEELIESAESYTAIEDGYHAAEKLLARQAAFTAIFAANDAMAIGAMRCLQERGRDIPADISIVGFDDIEACTHTQPQLTTVRVDKEELGAVASRRLIEMIESKKEFLGNVFTPVEFVIRQSTAPLAK